MPATKVKTDKPAVVAELAESFRSSSAALLTEYRGLSVAQLTELRRALGPGTRYAIVKNTLTKIAARQAGLNDLDELLDGPTAIAFVSGDPVVAAKGLRDFSRNHPLLVIKGGVLDGAPLTTEEIRSVADLESREVLLAKLAGAMTASLSRAAALFQAPLAQVARLADALRQKLEADGATPAPAEAAQVSAEAPATEAPATEAPATEAAGTEADDQP